MTDDLDQLLLLGKTYLIDYSAAARLSADGRFEHVFQSLLNADKTIVISRAFNLYNTIFRKQADSKIRGFYDSIDSMMDRFRKEGRLVVSQSLSWESFIREYHGKVSVCMVLLEHSLSVERIRDMEVPTDFSVCLVLDEDFRTYPNVKTFLQSELSFSVHPVSRSTDYVDANLHCNIGDKVYDSDGQEIVLTEKISTGAEGIVFRTNDPKWVAKIYHKGVITPLRWRKLIRMLKKGIEATGICWPSKLLYTFNKIPVGFLMQTGSGYTLGSIFDGPDAIISKYPHWKRHDVAAVALSVLERIIFLHAYGVVIGDIQMKNIMMNDPEHVYLIDMDSVQIEDMPCPVGTEEYTSPELWDYSFSDILRRPIHEDYSCAILVFSILFCGQHPYAQRFGRETLREEIIEKAFPYGNSSSEESLVPIGGYDKIWETLPDRLQSMFIKAFREGVRYEPIEWYEAITEYRNDLVDGNYEDEESYLLFPHTDLSVLEATPDKPKSYKKSIREAIIHAPSESTKTEMKSEVFSSENLMYNRQEKEMESTVSEKSAFSREYDGYSGFDAKSESKDDPNSFQKPVDRRTQVSDEKKRSEKFNLLALFMLTKEFVSRNRRAILLGILLLLSIVLMIIIGLMFD
ncbi:MAG: hypothetical protein JW780_00685 [Clostridiales bacterium]|nr:hypothetical protein [Clostridiales bacterium]